MVGASSPPPCPVPSSGNSTDLGGGHAPTASTSARAPVTHLPTSRTCLKPCPISPCTAATWTTCLTWLLARAPDPVRTAVPGATGRRPASLASSSSAIRSSTTRPTSSRTAPSYLMIDDTENSSNRAISMSVFSGLTQTSAQRTRRMSPVTMPR